MSDIHPASLDDAAMTTADAHTGALTTHLKMNPKILVLLCAMLALPPMRSLAEAGKAAPNCTLAPLGQRPGYDLSQFRGKVLYVDFWASWCGPCAQSFPFLNELHHALAQRGLEIVGINLDENPEDAKAFLAQHPAHFAVATDAGGNCPGDFGVQAMPSSYLIDRRGVIRHVHLGFRPGETGEIRGLAEQLLAEQPADR